MEQKEIYQNLPQGEWVKPEWAKAIFEHPDPTIGRTFNQPIQIGGRSGVSVLSMTNNPAFIQKIQEGEAASYAIVSAVNNTYGNGIDPTKVSEMYMMLVKLKNYMEKYGYADTANEIQQLLTAAKL